MKVSRGFESRPLCVTVYRMHRGPALMMSGALAVVAAVAVFLAVVLLQFDGVGRLVGWVMAGIAIATVIRAVWLGLMPPAVLKMDASGLRFRVRGGAARVSWIDVENVTVDREMIRVDTVNSEPIVVPLGLFDEARRIVLLRDLHDRLNTANGYERFTLD